MEKFTIGFFQPNIGKERSEILLESLEAINSLRDVNLMVFPEMWLTGFRITEKELEVTENFVEEVLERSKKIRSIIVLGTLPEYINGRIYNTSFVIAQGTIIARRRKMYLFEPMGENKTFTPGEEPEPIKVKGFPPFGIIICYELRFPELTKKLALMGAEIVICPAQWPENREEHWRLLLRARAIESQVFMVGVNVSGKTNYTFNGYSAIIHPLGYPVIEVSHTDGCFVGSININDIKEYRKSIPTLRDSRSIWT